MSRYYREKHHEFATISRAGERASTLGSLARLSPLAGALLPLFRGAIRVLISPCMDGDVSVTC